MDYTTMKFKANFIWSTETGIPSNIKERIEKMFMYLRNVLIEDLNPYYEEWNKEYDARYGEEGRNSDGTVIEKKYSKFIQVKQNEIIDKFNEEYCKGSGFSLWSDENADICMIVKPQEKIYKDAIIHLALEPIQE